MDTASAIAVDDAVYITGSTRSSNYPTTSNAYDTTFNNNNDAFISKLDKNLTSGVAGEVETLTIELDPIQFNQPAVLILSIDKSVSSPVNVIQWVVIEPDTDICEVSTSEMVNPNTSISKVYPDDFTLMLSDNPDGGDNLCNTAIGGVYVLVYTNLGT